MNTRLSLASEGIWIWADALSTGQHQHRGIHSFVASEQALYDRGLHGNKTGGGWQEHFGVLRPGNPEITDGDRRIDFRDVPDRLPAHCARGICKRMTHLDTILRVAAEQLPAAGVDCLTVLNDLDLEQDIRPLCEQFGTEEVFGRIRDQVKALKVS